MEKKQTFDSTSDDESEFVAATLNPYGDYVISLVDERKSSSFVPHKVDEKLKSESEFNFETPPYLYGPDIFKDRTLKINDGHVGLDRVLTRHDDIPLYLKDMVAPDTIDGYEGLNLRELEDDADSMGPNDPWAYKNWVDGVDLFPPSR